MQNLFGVIGTDKGIDYSCPELVEIPSKNVTGYITEIGICPAYALYEVSRRFVEGMGMLDE
jgi:translation initiation factor 2B subunit (eIF-2B alpha/beta/delta family)